MLTVARVTFKRLIKEKPVLIALFMIPVLIILIFSKMSAVPTEEAIKYRVGILKQDQQSLTDVQERRFTWVTYESEEGLKNGVLRGLVSSGILFEKDKVSEVLASNEGFGSFILSAFDDETLVEVKKESSEDKKGQIKVILNFLINYMLFSMIFIATDITQLKNLNILKRMGSMPLSSSQMFGGLLLAFTALLTLQVIEINFVIYMVLGVPISQNLILSTLVFMLMSGVILSFGLLVTRFTENSSIIPILCNFIAVPLMMISGTFMPVDQHPIFSKIKFISPQYWVVDAVSVLNRGQGQVGLHLLVLFTMGFVIFTMSIAGRKPSMQ